MDKLLITLSPYTHKRLFKLITPHVDKCSSLALSYKEILNEFFRFNREDSIEDYNEEDNLILDFKKISNEMYNIFITIYLRFISSEIEDFKFFKSLHIFMINLPPSETSINALQSLIEVLDKRLQSETLMCSEVSKVHFYLIQTLAILASLCEDAENFHLLCIIYDTLIRKLDVIDRISDIILLDETCWVNRKDKLVLVLDHRKCLSLYYSKEPKFTLQYYVFYCLWKIGKINIKSNKFKGHEKTLKVISSNLMKNSICLYEVNDNIKFTEVIKVYNENMVLLKFLLELFNNFPDFFDYIELYLEDKFKLVVVSFFSLIIKIEKEGLRTDTAISRIFLLLRKARKAFPKSSFELHKEIFDFFNSTHQLSNKNIIMKEVVDYYCEENIQIGWFVKIFESIISNPLPANNQLKVLIELLNNNISKEMTSMDLPVRIVNAIRKIWIKLSNKEHINEVKTFIYDLTEARIEILKSIEWNEEICFTNMLIQIITTPNQDPTNKGLRMLSNLIYNEDYKILKNHQGAIYNNTKWFEIAKELKDYNYVIELLQFIKHLTYHNEFIKIRLEEDFYSRGIKLGRAIAGLILNDKENIVRILLEIVFEERYELIKEDGLLIRKPYFFNELISFLYNLLKNKHEISNYMRKILNIVMKCYENYSLISSVYFFIIVNSQMDTVYS